MRQVKENVATALPVAALIVVAFSGLKLHLLTLMVVVAVIAYLAFVPPYGSIAITRRSHWLVCWRGFIPTPPSNRF